MALICILFGGWSDNGAEGLKYGPPIPYPNSLCRHRLAAFSLDRSLEIKFQTVRPEYQAVCPYKSQTNPPRLLLLPFLTILPLSIVPSPLTNTVFQTKGESGRAVVIRDRRRRRRRWETGTRIRKEAIWPTECPVRTRYKGFPYHEGLGTLFTLDSVSVFFTHRSSETRFPYSLSLDSLDVSRSFLHCESYVLESALDTWRGGRENLIFRPEPGVPRLDDPRYSRYLQFDAIPESGRDSSFVKLFSIRVRGDERCCFALKEDSNRWKDLKFRSNVNESRNDDKGGRPFKNFEI